MDILWQSILITRTKEKVQKGGSWEKMRKGSLPHNTSNYNGEDCGSRYAFSIRDGDTEVVPGGSERGNILV